MMMHFTCNSQDFFTKIWTFWQIQKCWSKSAKNTNIFGFLAEQFILKLLLFLNGLSYRYPIGLILKLINNGFKKYKKGNLSSMVHHIGHKKNSFLDKNFDQELIHRS